MKTDLYIDIETIPAINPVEYAKDIDIQTPGNYKSEEAIKKYIAQKRDSIVDDITKEASLNPLYGKVVSIAMRYKGKTYSCCSDTELDIIGYLATFIDVENITWEATRLITFNGKAFDVPFLNIRAKYEILPNQPKYNQDVHFDAYLYVSNFGGFRSSTLRMTQNHVAAALGCQEGIGSGSEVYKQYLAGDFDSIRKHNESDVEQLECICNRLGVGVIEPQMPF